MDIFREESREQNSPLFLARRSIFDLEKENFEPGGSLA
jgi:hypothetical protein